MLPSRSRQSRQSWRRSSGEPETILPEPMMFEPMAVEPIEPEPWAPEPMVPEPVMFAAADELPAGGPSAFERAAVIARTGLDASRSLDGWSVAGPSPCWSCSSIDSKPCASRRFAG
jgi:hypothetical protein